MAEHVESLKLKVDSTEVDKGKKSLDGLNTSANKVDSSAQKTTQSFITLNKAITVAGATALAIQYVKLADTMTGMQSKLRLVTSSTEELISAQKELFNIAQRTRQDFAETVNLYSNFATSMGEMGKSQKEILKITETVNKAMVISGGTTQEAETSLRQLGQAFSSGALRGDELNAILENSKGLAQAIADGMGVPIGQLRTLGSEGKITAEVLASALEKSANSIDSKFSQVGTTVSQSMTVASNSLLSLIGDLDTSIGVTSSLSSEIVNLSSNIDDSKDSIINFGRFSVATLSRTIDMFGLLGAYAKNTVEYALGAISTLYYGVMSPITSGLLTATEALNSVGLSSNKTLQNAQALANGMANNLKLSKQSMVDDVNDLNAAIEKASPTIEDRIEGMIKQGEKLKKISKNGTTKTAAKAESKEEKKAREQLEKERISALEGYAELQANQALEDYNNKLHYLDAYADLEAQKAIDQFNIEQGYLTDLAEQQARYAIDLYDSITPDSQKIIEKYATIFQAMKDMSAEMLNGFAEQMNEELDAVKVDSFTIEFDTQSLEKVPKAIAAVSKSMSDLQKADVKYQENKKNYQKGTIQYSKNEESYTRNQITGYSNLAGAMSNMFEEGSKEAQAMQTVQAGLALVEATLAVVHAGTGGDVYTAIPRMIATAAMAGTALSNIGTSFSGGGASVSMPVENTGTGTVLGDVSAQSESIKNSLEKMADLAKPEFQLTSQMAKSLQSIDNKLGGVSANILKVGGFATGAGGVSVSAPNAVVATVESAIDRTLKILEKSPLNIGGIMSAAFLGSGAGLAQKLIGGMFGGGASTSTIGAGLQFNPQQLQDAIKSLSGASFQTTLTEKKGGWFSKGSSSVADSFSALDEYTKNQFQLVLKDLYDVTDRSATSLGESVTSLLDNLVINIGRINLMGKTGDQIQAQLEAVFSSIGDNMATTALPLLLPFQKIGEGMFETMTRVASGMEQANYYTDRLGVTFQKINYKDILDKQGEVSGEALKQAIGLFEGVTNGVTDMVNSISGTASDVYTAYLSLDKMRYQLEAITGNFDDLSATMAYGSGGLDELSSGMEDYINNFLSEQEQLAYKTSLMTKEFERIGVAMPTSAEGFKQLVQGIDTSTEAGKDLYGRIIILSDSFSELASSSDSLKSTLFDNIQKFIDGLNKSLASKDPSVSFYKFTSSFNDMIDAIENGSSNLLDVGNVALNNAQSYLDTVTATATAGRDIEFAKAMLVNKFSGVINAPDVSLNTINTTLNMNNMALINELEALKFELASIKELTITSTATQLNTLTTQRAILGFTSA